MKKKLATHISDDYAFELVEVFQDVVTEQLENQVSLQDIIERHLDISKYDISTLMVDIKEFDSMDILESIMEEFEHKFVTQIATRMKERILELDIEDYLL